MIGNLLTISKRVLLFIATNLIIILTLQVVLGAVSAYFGIEIQGFTLLLIMYSVLGMGGALVSLWMSKWVAIRTMRVQVVSEKNDNTEIRSLVQKVHHLSIKAGLPKKPTVGIYNNPEINAFATGPSKKNSLVAVSSGLLQKMNAEEVEGVLAHEVSHIANGDMVTMTLVQGVVNVMVHLIAHLIASVVEGMISRNRHNFFLHWMLRSLFATLLYIPGSMLVCYFSRWREYRADYGGAQLAGRQKMILALQALAKFIQPQQPAMAQSNTDEQTKYNYLKISNNKKSRSTWVSLFSTHPPLENRIQRLQKHLIT